MQKKNLLILLQELLNYTGDDVEEVFCLNFTIAETYFGEVINKPLKTDGENIPVTRANREEFVKLYVDYVLNKSCEAPFETFKKGFLRVVNNQVLQLFHAKVGTGLDGVYTPRLFSVDGNQIRWYQS